MSWKRPLWFWVVAYLWSGVAGSVSLCCYALYLCEKDGDYGGPLGFVIGMILMACVGAAGGLVFCAVIQFGLWLHETLKNNAKRRL